MLLVLVAALVGLVGWNGRPAAGQCTMPLYNDGFVSFDTTRYLNIASPSFQLKSTPWSISMVKRGQAHPIPLTCEESQLSKVGV